MDPGAQPEADQPTGSPARPAAAGRPTLGTVLREWGRIGCLGFGGPPAHIKLLRDLCVERESWLEPRDFEDAIAVCNLLPGPASAQLAIFCDTRHAPGRRAARVLLASGPIAGACWGAALAVARAWTWPMAATAWLAFGPGLLLAIGALAGAATSTLSYRRTMLAAPGGIMLVMLDSTMIMAVVTDASAITLMLAIAIAASMARIGLAARLVPRVFAS